MIILYDHKCTPCLRKELWKEVKRKCRKDGLILTRKDTSKDLVARDEANTKYGLPTPFIVVDGQAMSVEEFLALYL